jgi:uncharacterized protein (TIGR04255 family)
MSDTPMGSWRNPPLAYVVAELQISPFYQLGNHVAEFQGAIRERFPRTEEANVVRLQIQGNAPMAQTEKVWRFFSENRRLGVNLSSRAISLHATEYEDFPAFSQTIKLVVSAAERAIPGLFVEQLGLRYIDYLLPKEGESTWDYVAESLRGVTPAGSTRATEAYWIANYEFAQGSVSLRVIPVLPKGQVFPPNFGPIAVAPAETQSEAMRRDAKGEPVGCIDTDRLMPMGKKLSSQDVVDALSAMHTDVFDTFRATMSKKAEEAWI